MQYSYFFLLVHASQYFCSVYCIVRDTRHINLYSAVMLGGASFYRGHPIQVLVLVVHANQFLFCHLLWVI